MPPIPRILVLYINKRTDQFIKSEAFNDGYTVFYTGEPYRFDPKRGKAFGLGLKWILPKNIYIQVTSNSQALAQGIVALGATTDPETDELIIQTTNIEPFHVNVKEGDPIANIVFFRKLNVIVQATETSTDMPSP